MDWMEWILLAVAAVLLLGNVVSLPLWAFHQSVLQEVIKMKDRIIPSTMIFRTLPLKKALEHIRNAGYEKAELCVVPGWVDHYDVRNATPEKLAEAISTVAASGVRIVAVNFGLSWLDEAGNIDYDMDRIARNALNLTSALGAKVMTFAAGRIPPDGKRQNWLKKIAGRNA